jgi:hypothetical protein
MPQSTHDRMAHHIVFADASADRDGAHHGCRHGHPAGGVHFAGTEIPGRRLRLCRGVDLDHRHFEGIGRYSTLAGVCRVCRGIRPGHTGRHVGGGTVGAGLGGAAFDYQSAGRSPCGADERGRFRRYSGRCPGLQGPGADCVYDGAPQSARTASVAVAAVRSESVFYH